MGKKTPFYRWARKQPLAAHQAVLPWCGTAAPGAVLPPHGTTEPQCRLHYRKVQWESGSGCGTGSRYYRRAVLPLHGTTEPQCRLHYRRVQWESGSGCGTGPRYYRGAVLPLLERYYRPGRAREPHPKVPTPPRRKRNMWVQKVRPCDDSTHHFQSGSPLHSTVFLRLKYQKRDRKKNSVFTLYTPRGQ